MSYLEDFDAKLEELLDECTGADLLAIPGLYEVVSEHFNNKVIAAVASDKDLAKRLVASARGSNA